MNRRSFSALLAGGSLYPDTATSQFLNARRRIAHVDALPEAASNRRRASWSQALAALGWIEGEDVHSIYRSFAEQSLSATTAKELAGLGLDAIVIFGFIALDHVAVLDRTTPIVCYGASDERLIPYAGEYGRPRANVTGVTSGSTIFLSKQIESLIEVAPNTKRIAFLCDH